MSAPSRFRPVRLLALFALLGSAAFAACLDVVQPGEVNVVVAIADVPAAASLHVELTDQDGTVLERDPPFGQAVSVAFAHVKPGDITVTAAALDQTQRVVARAHPLRAKATSARGNFHMSFLEEPPDAGSEPDAGTADAGDVSDGGESPDGGQSPDGGTPSCVDFDEQGYACPHPLATVSNHPHAMIGVGSLDAPAVLTFGDPSNTAALVREGQELPLFPNAVAGATVVSDDGLAVLVPFGDAANGYRIALLRPLDGLLVDLAQRAAPGKFGLLADGTAWAIDSVDDTGFGQLVVVRPGESAPTTDASCQLRARGPISRISGSSSISVVFEQAQAPSVVMVTRHGSCRQSPTGDDSAQPGTWSANPDATRLLYYSHLSSTFTSIVSGSEEALPQPMAEPDGATLLSDDGSFLHSSAAGLFGFDPGSHTYSLLSDAIGVVDFFADPQQPFSVGRGRDGTVVLVSMSGVATLRDALAPLPVAGDTSGRHAVLWEAANSTPGIAGVWTVALPNPAVRIGDGPVGGARRWATNSGEVLVVALSNGLFDAASGQQLVRTVQNPAFDISAGSLVFVDALNRARLMDSPAGTASGLTRDAATAVAAVHGDPTKSFWVARAVGDVVRVAAPKGVTP